MKRFTVILSLLLLVLFAPAPQRAQAAEERYAAAVEADVWFYASENENARVFLLPATYYVKVISEGETYTRVEYLTDDAPYQKISGYCRTEDLLFVDYIPVRPYLKKEVTLSYTLPQTGGLGSGSFSTVEKTFVYYGHRYEGDALYYYVLSGDTFDYIPAEKELEYEKNTDCLDYLAAKSASGEAEGGQGGMNASTILVICIACAAAIAIAVLVVRGKRAPVAEDHED